MANPPSARVRELETLLATIGAAKNVQLNYEMWDDHGREVATAEERAQMEADLAQSQRDGADATAALTELVARTRGEAPAELVAWADAHDAYLAGFLADCAARGDGDGTAADVATRERGQWAEVRAGARAFVDGNGFYVTLDAARYRELFGIDPR